MAKRTAWKNLTTKQRVQLQRTRARRTATVKHLKEKLTMLTKQRDVIAKQLATAVGDKATMQNEYHKLELRLLEARRRTIPFGTYRNDPAGKPESELNFLPLCVLEYRTEFDHARVASMSGFEQHMVTGARFLLTVLAVMDPAVDAPVQYHYKR